MRQAAIKARTALINQMRGLLAEYGIIFGTGAAQARRRAPEILENGQNGLTERFRCWLDEWYEQLREWDRRIRKYDREVDVLFRADKRCGRIAAVELVTERGKNRAAVALANKNARIIWALLTREEVYRSAAC
ncbi:MAG: hypothetical protein AB2806_19495 [Candidatus Thiodiazotropha sp.]